MSNSRTISDTQALDTISEILSTEEWNCELWDTVADFIRWTGRPIENPEEDYEP